MQFNGITPQHQIKSATENYPVKGYYGPNIIEIKNTAP